MQESRLFRIVYYLLDKGRATAWELAEKFEVSVRTIYRDIDALSGAGIPVYAEPGRNGGIRLLKGFVLDKAVLSEQEKRDILDAVQSLHAAQNMDGSDMLSKLSALFRVSSGNWLEVDFSRWGGQTDDNEKFELLKLCVVSHRSVRIVYAGTSGEISERVIWPLKLIYKSRAWYVKAFCTRRQEERLFKLTRILEWEVVSESAVPCPVSGSEDPTAGRTPLMQEPHSAGQNLLIQEPQCVSRDASVQELQSMSRNPLMQEPQNMSRVPLMQELRSAGIKLRFPREMAYRVYDEFAGAEIERQANGDFIVSAAMPEDAWLVGFLLSFGTKVDVIEPAYLRAVLAEQAKLMFEKYKT